LPRHGIGGLKSLGARSIDGHFLPRRDPGAAGRTSARGGDGPL